MTAPAGFRHTTPLAVRFADLDAMGHLNHARYLTYMEQARILYVRDVCTWGGDWSLLGMILARAEVDYKLPLAFGDSAVVYTRCSRLGNKSFDLEYVLLRQRPGEEDVLASTARTVMVAYDYRSDRPIPVPESWRERILAYEPEMG